MDICFRSDKYGLGVFAADNGKELRLDARSALPYSARSNAKSTMKSQKFPALSRLTATTVPSGFSCDSASTAT